MSRQILLASSSLRRKQLLEQIGLTFKVVISDYVEDMSLPLIPEKLVVHLAAGKAEQVAAQHPEAIVIGADSIVVVGDAVLGKPKSPAEAEHMLQKLSGREHEVLTGLSVMCQSTAQRFEDFSRTTVHFRDINETEIQSYVATGEPMDKAGAYAIQGRGAIFVTTISGDYYNVVGLPLTKLWLILQYMM